MMKTNIEAGKENMMLDVIVPGIFMTVLIVCIAELGLSAFQSESHQATMTQYVYAISAFAN